MPQRRQAEKHPRGMARHLAQKLTALELPVEIVPLQERDAHEARDSDDCVLKIDEVYMSLRTRRHKAVL